MLFVVAVQLLNHVWHFGTPWTAAHQVPLSSIISQSLLKFMSIEPVMLFNHLIVCHPLLLLSSVFPRIRVFPSELALYIRWPTYWSFSFSISPSNECLGLISLRINWFDLFVVQGTLRVFSNNTVQKIDSSVLSFLYGPPVISTHDYWKNHSFDYTDFFQKSDFSNF